MLNPAIHTRIFYKLALSQQKIGHSVVIIGQSSRQSSFLKEGIKVIPLGKFNRLSFNRFFAGFKILRLVSKEKADAFCIHTPELLWLGLFLKWTKRTTLLYDMHEDYRVTIRNAQHYPSWLRRPLAACVRSWERFCLRWIDGVSYAEMSYDNVLGVEDGKKVVLRNMFRGESREKRIEIGHEGKSELESESGGEYMLYTGTLAEDWGIWETIEWWEKFNAVKALKLVMAGFSFDKGLIERIEERIERSPFAARFELVGGRDYVPYEQILHLIENCSFGTAFYHLKAHIIGKVPTKFYEYMAFDKPLLFTKDSFWEDFNQKNQLGIAISGNEDPNALLTQLENWNVQHDPSTYSWSYDALRMQEWLTEIFSNHENPSS